MLVFVLVLAAGYVILSVALLLHFNARFVTSTTQGLEPWDKFGSALLSSFVRALLTSPLLEPCVLGGVWTVQREVSWKAAPNIMEPSQVIDPLFRFLSHVRLRCCAPRRARLPARCRRSR